MITPPPRDPRGDLDNKAKIVLDALTQAGVWKDDGQVAQLVLRRHDAPKAGRLVVGITPLDRTPRAGVRRDDDQPGGEMSDKTTRGVAVPVWLDLSEGERRVEFISFRQDGDVRGERDRPGTAYLGTEAEIRERIRQMVPGGGATEEAARANREWVVDGVMAALRGVQ